MRFKSFGVSLLVGVGLLGGTGQVFGLSLVFNPSAISVTSAETATMANVAVNVSGSAGEQVISGQVIVMIQVSGPGDVTIASGSGLTAGTIFASASGTQAPIPVDTHTHGVVLFAPTDDNTGLPVAFALTDGVLVNVTLS